MNYRNEKGQFVKGHKTNEGRGWIQQQIGYLKEHYPNESNTKLSIKLSKTKGSILAKARKLGLQKTPKTLSRSLSESLRGKAKLWLRGSKHSKEHKEKISAGLRKHYETHDGPWKGKHHTEEHKRNLSMKLKGKINLGDKNPAKQPEVRRRIAQTLRNGASSFYKFKEHPEWRRKNLEACAKRPTVPERDLINIIKKYHLPFNYVGNGKIIMGTINPDFIHNNGAKKVIEVFGRVFHDSECKRRFTNIPWNRQYWGRMANYAQHGYDCLIFWDDELKDERVVASKVKAFLSD